MKINLIDINQRMTDAWEKEFIDYSDVNVINGSIFDVLSDTIVSPANSFGIMDGGIDGKIRDYFGFEIEKKVRQKIDTEYFGELPVGCAILTKTDDNKIKYLISAPTMRVPENVSDTLNAYLAMRAIMSVCILHDLRSVSIPGLCSLSGSME